MMESHYLMISDVDTHKIYMMTPSDQISHDLSYFSGPSTSGAENTISRNLAGDDIITNIVGGIAGGLQCLPDQSLLCKAKVCEFQDPVITWG